MDEDELMIEDAGLFTFAQAIGELCSKADKIQDPDLKAMVRNAALLCLRRITDRPKTELHMFHGGLQ